MRQRGTGRKIVTFGAAALVLSACGPSGFTVGMERLISNVVFGAFQPKAAPSPQPLPEVPALPALPPFAIPAPGAPDLGACPSAPPGTPADKAASSNVDSTAQNGLYKWFSSYTRGTNATSNFEQRKVENAQYLGTDVTSTGGQTDYVYQWTEFKPDPWQAGYVDELTFQARTYSNLDNPPATFLISAQYGGNYDPNAGIDLVDLKRFSPTDSKNPVEEYAPNQGSVTIPSQQVGSETIAGQQASGTPGLLIFTLPVPGASTGVPVLNQPPPPPLPNPNPNNEFTWQASASDPLHQWTESINATEGNQRTVVPSCGIVIDGWPVTATLTIAKNDPATGQPYPSPLTIQWKYVVAPQYGGLIVSEVIEGDGGYGSVVKTQEVLASVDVAPLPKGS